MTNDKKAWETLHGPKSEKNLKKKDIDIREKNEKIGFWKKEAPRN